MRDIMELYEVAPQYLLSGDMAGLTNAIKLLYPGLAIEIKSSKTSRNPLHVFWEAYEDVYRFHMQSFESFDIARIVTFRFLCMLDLFLLCQQHNCVGRTLIDLEDIGSGVGLRFCDHITLDTLIPDSDFLASGGYRMFRQDAPTVPWHSKKDVVLWRGSSTGLRGEGGLRDLPRIQLCLKARNHTVLDCAMSHLVQISDDEQEWIKSQGLMGEFIPMTDYPYYKYHIDIDGNSNAWSALFYKLLSESVVFKVQSVQDYRQWYYDLLIPWKNFVPVKSDLSDLSEVVEIVRADSDLAQRIASEGRKTALGLDYESQLLVARDRVTEALKEGAATMAEESGPTITFNGDQSASRLAMLLANAVERGQASDGKVSEMVLAMPGMSGRNYRYTINNLVASVPNARYLEIGSWAGSTSCAAMDGNRVRAVCIDNWSEFGGPKDMFLENTSKLRGPYADFLFIESDFREVSYASLGRFNVYLFDGPHSEKDQYDGLALVLPALDDEFVFIVDDWNWDHVRRGTMSAISENALDNIFYIEVRTTLDNSHPIVCQERSQWHNGCFFGVLRKRKVV